MFKFLIARLIGVPALEDSLDVYKRLDRLERLVSRHDVTLFDLKNEYQATLSRFEKRVVMRTIKSNPAQVYACDIPSCTLKPAYCPTCSQSKKEVSSYGF